IDGYIIKAVALIDLALRVVLGGLRVDMALGQLLRGLHVDLAPRDLLGALLVGGGGLLLDGLESLEGDQAGCVDRYRRADRDIIRVVDLMPIDGVDDLTV